MAFIWGLAGHVQLIWVEMKRVRHKVDAIKHVLSGGKRDVNTWEEEGSFDVSSRVLWAMGRG